MKDVCYYIGSFISASLSFIQELIPVVQFILLLLSLTLTLIGIGKQIKEKLVKGEDISNEIKDGVNAITEVANKIKEGNEDGRENKDNATKE